MERLIEGTPGQEAAVWVQDRGGGPLRMRGTIQIEDLSGVLTTLASRNGANGPLNPVTQYMLSQAARHLADRLIEDAPPAQEGPDSVPRILSTALGHQPFVEQVLGMSQHQMLRRWPLAADWYTDVIGYVLRPARFDPKLERLVDTMRHLTAGPLGELARAFAQNAFTYVDNEKIVRVAEALQALWPDYPPVSRAMAHYRQHVQTSYVPLYLAVARTYGLVMREGIDIAVIGWAFNSLQSREALENLAGQTTTWVTDDGADWSMTARSVMMIIAGSCTDEDGEPLDPVSLPSRLPVRPFEFLAEA